MKKTIKVIGFIVLITVIGFSMVTCGGDEAPPNGGKTDPSVLWPTGLTATVGQILADISLTGKGTGEGDFIWTNPTNLVGAAGQRTHNMTFIPWDTANYNTVYHDITITVSTPKTDPSVTWPEDLTLAATVGQKLSQVTITGGSGDGEFTWTSPNDDVGTAGQRWHSMTFTPTETAIYNTLYRTIIIIVNNPTYTVTFDSNNGSEVDPIPNLSYGVKVTAPTAPTFADHIFQGWYKEDSFTSKWNFTTDTVTDDITLYAKWIHKDGPFILGDIGPGGGIIFHVDPDGFTIQMVNPNDNYTAHYLETAPTNASTSQWRGNIVSPLPLIAGITTFTDKLAAGASEIGNGRKDTQLIFTNHTGAAAKACVDYRVPGNDLSDWFLPSLGELLLLSTQRNLTGINITTTVNPVFYWSSSQYDSDNAWVVSSEGPLSGYLSKHQSGRVRAVRAF